MTYFPSENTAETDRNAGSLLEIGRWVLHKWQTRLADSGGNFHAVATQLRKQGVPLEVALALLCGRGLQ